MASTPVVPAAPAASTPSTPAASSTPASSTPAPAAPSAPAPASGTQATSESTPAAVAPPAAGGAVDVAPAAAAAPVVDVAPKQEDFPGDVEGYHTAKFEYNQKHGLLEGEANPDKPAGDVPAETEAPAATEDGTEPELPEEVPEVLVTPEVISAWSEKNPQFKAALDADGDLKGALYQMARTNAKASPILEIFPNAESAKFANEAASEFVGLQSGFQLAVEDPESFPAVFSKFEDLFKLKDKDGNYVKDAAGNIAVGEDFNMLTNHLVGGYHRSEAETYSKTATDLEARLESAVYPNQAAREADEKKLEHAQMAASAFKFIEELRSGGDVEKPDLSKIADPETRAYYERKEQELQQERERLGLDKKDHAVSARKAERQQYEQGFRSKFGGQVGGRIGSILNEKITAGTFIPSYVLEAKDGSGAPVFAVNVLKDFEKKLDGIAQIKDHRAKLQMAKPSEASMKARLDYENQLIEEYLPSIVDSHVKQVQGKERSDRKARAEQAGKRGEVASFEPRSGSSPRPSILTEEQLSAEAIKVAQSIPGYDQMDESDKMVAQLSAKYKLRSQPPPAR